MFNIVFIFGPQGASLRFTFKTEEARATALSEFKAHGSLADDVGQEFFRGDGVVHGTVLTSDQSDAAQALAPHNVQMAANKMVEDRKAADPAFNAYIIRASRTAMGQQGHMMGSMIQ